jgi:hypothetical protein
MYRIITVEREFGSGAGEIARELATRLGWKLWDHALTEEIAKLSHVECAAVEKFEERVDSTFRRLAKVFWRGSYERSMPLADEQSFDADCFVATGKQVMASAAAAGNCVIVGRGAPYFLREQPRHFPRFLLRFAHGKDSSSTGNWQIRRRSGGFSGYRRPRSNHFRKTLFQC